MSNLFNARGCEFVRVDGVWLPGVAGVEINPVYIGDYGRAVSGVLRSAHVGVAREWRVLLTGVDSDHTMILDELLSNPNPVGCVVMGEEVIASVRLVSSSFVPRRHEPNVDWGRRNYELLIQEAFVEQITPGFTYEYQAFFDTGSFVWDWNAAGQPDEVDVLLVAGGGGGGAVAERTQFGAGGGGGGGVQLVTGISVSGNVSGSVGAGGPPEENGQNSTFGAHTAIGGGHGGGITIAAAGGSGGGGKHPDPAGTGSQGHNGGAGNGQTGLNSSGGTQYGGGGGGGGAGGPGHPGVAPNRARGAGGPGGQGTDLLSLGWNYRLTPPAPRYVAGGGGGGVGGWDVSTTTSRPAPAPGGIGGGGRGGGPNAASKDGEDGRVNTGGGGGASSWSSGSGTPGAGGSGLVIVRWLVNS